MKKQFTCLVCLLLAQVGLSLWSPGLWAWGVQVGAGAVEVRNTDDSLAQPKQYFGTYFKFAGFYNLTTAFTVLVDSVAVINPALEYVPVRGYSLFITQDIMGSSTRSSSNTEKVFASYTSNFRLYYGLGLQFRKITRVNPQSDDYLRKGGKDATVDKPTSQGEETEEEKLKRTLKYFTSDAMQVSVLIGYSYFLSEHTSIFVEGSGAAAKSVEGNYKFEFFSFYEAALGIAKTF